MKRPSLKRANNTKGMKVILAVWNTSTAGYLVAERDEKFCFSRFKDGATLTNELFNCQIKALEKFNRVALGLAVN